MNKVFLVGNLGKNVELKNTSTGMAVCKFSVATTEMVKNEKKVEWHNVVFYGKLAELCSQYLIKGDQVLIEGRVTTRSWDKDNQKHYITEIVGQSIKFLSKKERNFDNIGSDVSNNVSRVESQDIPMFDVDEIPF